MNGPGPLRGPRWMTAAIVVAAVLAAPTFATPYAGQQDRAIAALSAQDIDDLLEGRGWGLALPAELNGWPGPAHVLELSEALGLSEPQLAEVQALYGAMLAEAQRIGAAYVAAEAALDAAFAEGTPTPADLDAALAEAEALRAELRAVHLAAHLQTRPLLTRHQIMTYNRLRGYGDGESAGHGAHSAH